MGEGETICWVSLPAPVEPGGSVAIDVEWDAVFPKMRLGCGWADGFLVASLWYPKLCRYGADGWVVEPLGPCCGGSCSGHFGDYGDYDVELSLPNALQLANTGMVLVPLDGAGRPMRDQLGREVEAVQDPGRRFNFIYKIRARNVRDFSWIATPNGNWRLSRLDWGDTQVYIYGIHQNGSQQKRLREAIKSALHYAEERLAPYPYPALSVVDLPAAALGGGAVSAPGLVAISNVAFDPYHPYGQRFVPEQAVIRQMGDQWFRWALAADADEGSGGREFLDGLSGWFTDRVMARDYPRIMHTRRFSMDAGFRHWQARLLFSCLPFFPLRPPAPPFPGALGSPQGHGASGLFSQMEALIGEDAMESAVGSYLAECSFWSSAGPSAGSSVGPPGMGDFVAAAERASGMDMGAFRDDRAAKADAPDCSVDYWMDYRIKGVAVLPDGRGAVTLERAGAAAVPIALRVRMKDGRESIGEWDGKDRQATLHFDGPIAEVWLDPEGKYPALKGRLHTAWTAAPKRHGLFYWASMASGAICGLLQGMGIG
jgi:hypothetical protein